jgi:hypothetical protein
MAKPPRNPDPDPMAVEVDRLLAQIGHGHGGSRRATVSHGGSRRASASTRETGPAASGRRNVTMLWLRLLLASGLGAMMTQWPYRFDCDWPLAGYLGAVAMIVLTAGWLMIDAWRMRQPVAHVAALVLAFWGIVLAAEQLLPRIGYAAEVAVWQCVGG